MSTSSSIHSSCPSNSTFFACDYGSRFLGCCLATLSSNEVCGNGCPTSSLQPASFEKQIYTDVTDGQCNSSEGKWYTCPDALPLPFLGCCNVDPCQKGCPAGGLVAATLSENQAQQAAYAPLIEGPTTVTSLTSTESSTALSTSLVVAATSSTASASSTTSSGAAPNPSATPKPKTSIVIGAVIGGVIGGIIISASIAALLIFWRRWKSHKKQLDAQNDGIGKPAPPNLFKRRFTSLPISRDAPDSDKTNLPSMYSMPGHSNALQELPASRSIQELPPSHVPVRELASLEVPAPVYELPSPVPSPQSLQSRPSFIKFNEEPNEPTNVSPLASPYTPDTPGAVSEISILEVGTRYIT